MVLFVLEIIFHFSLYVLILFDTGCNNASVYGSNCDIPCPANCKDSTCHIRVERVSCVNLGGLE